jgi:hypothetical protein
MTVAKGCDANREKKPSGRLWLAKLKMALQGSIACISRGHILIAASPLNKLRSELQGGQSGDLREFLAK